MKKQTSANHAKKLITSGDINHWLSRRPCNKPTTFNITETHLSKWAKWCYQCCLLKHIGSEPLSSPRDNNVYLSLRFKSGVIHWIKWFGKSSHCLWRTFSFLLRLKLPQNLFSLFASDVLKLIFLFRVPTLSTDKIPWSFQNLKQICSHDFFIV